MFWATSRRHRVPWTILVCATVLVLLGLSGIARGDELAGGGTCWARQMVWVSLALPVMFAVTQVPYRALRPSSYVIFGVALVLLLVVFAMPARHGARRWIPLGLLYFQPSELAKLAYILALSHYLMYHHNYRRLPGLVVPFLLTLVPVGLVLREPDLGTALLFLPVLFAMLFAAGARPRHLVLIGLLGVAVSPLLWLGMNVEQRSRIVAVFTQEDGGPLPKGDGYHLYQSKQMLLAGGIWGSELAADPERRAGHLPASRTDFVFCLVGERWGLAGCLVVLVAYTVLFVRGLAIAAATREPFGRLLAVGIVVLLASQTIINAGMTVGLMPITGMTLPLVSYGGSSLLATAVALGLLINVGMRPGYEITPEPFRFGAE